jgi:hypothetical protein
MLPATSVAMCALLNCPKIKIEKEKKKNEQKKAYLFKYYTPVSASG